MLVVALLITIQVGASGGAPVSLTDHVIARIPTGRAESALSPGCPDLGEDAASKCPPAFVFHGRGNDLLVWAGPHGNFKLLAVTHDSARLAGVVRGPQQSMLGELPFDGLLEPDGAIALVTESGRTQGRFRLYRHAHGATRWTMSVMDAPQIEAEILDSNALATDSRLVRDGAHLSLRRVPRRPMTVTQEVARRVGEEEAKLGGVTLDAGEGNTIACPDGSVLVFRWSEHALIIHRVSGAAR